jgi:hypothetical protein
MGKRNEKYFHILIEKRQKRKVCGRFNGMYIEQ